MHILLITRHFPPEPSGGARRPALLVEALEKLGHKVTLVTPFKVHRHSIVVPHPVEHIFHQTRLESAIDTDAPIKQGVGLRGILRQWLLLPDPDIRWAKKVRASLKQNPIKVDWVITTSPPESLHVVGAFLKKICGAKWLVDARDTWITAAHREVLESSRFRRWIEKRIARRALAEIDALVTVSRAVEEDLLPLCPPKTKSEIIGHFSNPHTGTVRMDEDRLNLVHTGGFTLSDRRRKLTPVLETLRKVRSQNPLPIHFHLAGRLDDEEKAILKENWGFKITFYGAVSLEQSRVLQNSADALLLLTPESSHALPGKYAEYCMAGGPILYTGGGDWLNLVDSSVRVFPLNSGLKTLKKATGEKVAIPEHLSAEYAAKKLIAFLESPSEF